MLARRLADLSGQPSVLWELLLGVLVGNAAYSLGHPVFVVIMHLDDAKNVMHHRWMSGEADDAILASIHHHQTPHLPPPLTDVLSSPDSLEILTAVIVFSALAQLGVLLLLFLAGLESDIHKMARIWRRCVSVAVVGVVAPFALGLAVCWWLHPEMSAPGHLFLAATLSATSVGITARVFEDLNQLHRREANVILGAAVIDDILGLILLTVAIGVASTDALSVQGIARTVIMSAIFLAAVLTCGERLVSWLARLFHKLDSMHSRLLCPLAVAFGLACIAQSVGLAAIVGAFLAGLIISDRQFSIAGDSATTIKQQVAAPERVLAPVFFLLTGMQVNLAYFRDARTLMLASAFTAAAITGKLVSGFFAGRDMDRLSVGVGMVPRGEVGLIFISMGRGLGVFGGTVYSALIVVVIVTTLITPPCLKRTLNRAAPLAP